MFRLMVRLDEGSFPNLTISWFYPKFMENCAQDQTENSEEENKSELLRYHMNRKSKSSQFF